jgi:predicted ATPase
MFSRIQTRHFRSLKSIDQSIGAIQALVGPNASGKTTFLDVIELLSALVRYRGDVREVIAQRSSNFQKLVWQGPGLEAHERNAFQLAIEAPIPDSVIQRMTPDKQKHTHIRYELEIGLELTTNEIGINHETLWLHSGTNGKGAVQREMFPSAPSAASSIFWGGSKPGSKVVLKKVPGGNDNYYPEGAKSYAPSFRIGRTKLALANIPADEVTFPVSTWFRDLLDRGVQNIMLNSQIIRQPSPPGLGRRFQPDGSNLPWVISELKKDGLRFSDWLAHVRTALEDIVDIDVIERDEDRHRYIVVSYANGAVVPSWLVSDGTLRLLALTITAYLTDLDGVFLIEEPENGIHPRAIETVIQSLSSIYGGQVLIATHSPVALNLLEPQQILCFAKDSDGATDIVSGDMHPALNEWKQGKPDLGTMFASGILS